MLSIFGWVISLEIALRCLSQDYTDDLATLVQVMAWCRQATIHYLSQCCPISLSPYGVTRLQWVNNETGRGFGFRLVNTGVSVLIALVNTQGGIINGIFVGKSKQLSVWNITPFVVRQGIIFFPDMKHSFRSYSKLWLKITVTYHWLPVKAKPEIILFFSSKIDLNCITNEK